MEIIRKTNGRLAAKRRELVRSFFVKVDSVTAPSDSIVLEAGSNLITGEDDFEQLFGNLSSLERDLLLISSSIFAADRAYLRGEREDICRAIELSIPVVNYARLQPLIRIVETALHRLSNDAWKLVLRQHMGTLEPRTSALQNNGITLLFSGGLDSLAAAITYGRSSNVLQLVSHVTRNRITDRSQQDLYNLLTASGYNLVLRRCFVSSRSGGPSEFRHDEENTQRTRSFVYLVLGALMAKRSGHTQLIYL
ncbi:hypothetical protein MUP79_02115, partial [Candidatus Bathyarchaeota archaeon]|nr:hypothetical protein [Candidatus Bathyarchaeota archaeon]